MDLWSASLEQSPDKNQPDPQIQSSKPGKSAVGNNKTSKSEKIEDPRRIGDIMLRYSPFLIMYTEYVKNFDTAMRTINNLYNKNSKFAAIMDSIHVSHFIFINFYLEKLEISYGLQSLYLSIE